MRPIAITLQTDQLVYPMRISRVSTLERAEIVLWVIAPDRVEAL